MKNSGKACEKHSPDLTTKGDAEPVRRLPTFFFFSHTFGVPSITYRVVIFYGDCSVVFLVFIQDISTPT